MNDAVTQKQEFTLCFYQVAFAHEHSLNLEYFCSFTAALVKMLSIEIRRIQIVIMSPNEDFARNFQNP